MHAYRSYWHVLIGILGLMLLLAGCGGGSSTTSTGTPQTTTNSTGTITSTLSFTVSGGLTGNYTFSTTGIYSELDTSAKNLHLRAQPADQSWDFNLYASPYTGAGSYKITVPPNGSTTAQFETGNKVWHLVSPSSCQLIVNSDTPTTYGGTNDHEIKGSFTCPSLTAPSPNGPAPVALNSGQFDVITS